MPTSGWRGMLYKAMSAISSMIVKARNGITMDGYCLKVVRDLLRAFPSKPFLKTAKSIYSR